MCGFGDAMGNLCSMGPRGLTISITISMPEPPSTRLGGEPDRCETVKDFRGKDSSSFGKMDKNEDDKSLDSIRPNKPKDDEDKDKEDKDERWY